MDTQQNHLNETPKQMLKLMDKKILSFTLKFFFNDLGAFIPSVPDVRYNYYIWTIKGRVCISFRSLKKNVMHILVKYVIYWVHTCKFV